MDEHGAAFGRGAARAGRCVGDEQHSPRQDSRRQYRNGLPPSALVCAVSRLPASSSPAALISCSSSAGIGSNMSGMVNESQDMRPECRNRFRRWRRESDTAASRWLDPAACVSGEAAWLSRPRRRHRARCKRGGLVPRRSQPGLCASGSRGRHRRLPTGSGPVPVHAPGLCETSRGHRN